MSIFDIFKKKNKQMDTESLEIRNKTISEIKEELKRLVKNSIEMYADIDSEVLKSDSSKIGGKPFLPAGFVWPVFDDKEDGVTRPLSFFCQLNLSELSAFDKEKQLPSKGLLLFFYECESFRWGFDPCDKGAARVFYFEDTADFVPLDIPECLDGDYRIPEIALGFETVESYPTFEEFEIYSDLDCDWEDFDEAAAELHVNLENVEKHKVLGYADVMQGEMLSECERVTRGMYCGDPGSYQNTTNEVEADINNRSKDWTLLLQLKTITKDSFEWMFGDCGMLYYYIRKEDLAKRHFDDGWFCVQCG